MDAQRLVDTNLYISSEWLAFANDRRGRDNVDADFDGESR